MSLSDFKMSIKCVLVPFRHTPNRTSMRIFHNKPPRSPPIVLFCSDVRNMGEKKCKRSILTKIRSLPSSWVMLSKTEGFVRLPNEHLIYTSPPRTSLSLKPPSSYSGKESFSINSGAGCVYLTNQRVRLPYLRCGYIYIILQLLTRLPPS